MYILLVGLSMATLLGTETPLLSYHHNSELKPMMADGCSVLMKKKWRQPMPPAQSTVPNICFKYSFQEIGSLPSSMAKLFRKWGCEEIVG